MISETLSLKFASPILQIKHWRGLFSLEIAGLTGLTGLNSTAQIAESGHTLYLAVRREKSSSENQIDANYLGWWRFALSDLPLPLLLCVDFVDSPSTFLSFIGASKRFEALNWCLVNPVLDLDQPIVLDCSVLDAENNLIATLTLPLQIDPLAYPHEYVPLALGISQHARIKDHRGLNEIVNVRKWTERRWRQLFDLLDLPHNITHRKYYEYVQAIYGLEKLGALQESAHGLGIAAGHECLIYYLANVVAKFYATDIYEGQFSGHEADPTMLNDPTAFAPYIYKKDHLVVERADGMALPYPDESFDFTISLSSIEHFGTYADCRQGAREMARILKPGGIAALATELSLNDQARAEPGNGPCVFFTPETLAEFVIDPSGLELIEGIDYWSLEMPYILDYVDMGKDHLKLPHFSLVLDGVHWTSVMLFLRKPLK